jgi:PST family polysaccharide transporter
MFAGFIIAAMGTDFYPRLTAVAHDNVQVNRLVNEQIEIGILLSLPGLLGTLAFAPWVMRLLYSVKFLPAAELLPWFVVGVFFQVVMFPMGYIQRAKAAARWIYIAQTSANVSHLTFVVILMPYARIQGVAYAYLLCASLHTVLVFLISRHLSSFALSPAAVRLTALSLCLILVGVGTRKIPGTIAPLVLGAFLSALGCIASLRGIASRLGSGHRAIRAACHFPGVRFVCGIK